MPKNTYLFACDENYLKHMAVAVKSLLYNNRYSGINVYFISDLSRNMLDKVFKIVESYGANFIKVKVNREFALRPFSMITLMFRHIIDYLLLS